MGTILAQALAGVEVMALEMKAGSIVSVRREDLSAVERLRWPLQVPTGVIVALLGDRGIDVLVKLSEADRPIQFRTAVLKVQEPNRGTLKPAAPVPAEAAEEAPYSPTRGTLEKR